MPDLDWELRQGDRQHQREQLPAVLARLKAKWDVPAKLVDAEWERKQREANGISHLGDLSRLGMIAGYPSEDKMR